MKKPLFQNKWTVILLSMFAVMLVAEVIAVVELIRLDMLPVGYMLLLIGLLVIFSLGIGLLLFAKGKRPGKLRKIVASVLAILLICGCVVISTVATDVLKTLQATTIELFEIPTREVYVLAENQTADLEDTVGFTYGYLKDYDESCTEQVFEKIHEKTGATPSTAGYTHIGTMITALLEERIDAIVLNGGIVSILEDTEEFLNFSEKTRVLAQVRVEEDALALDDITISYEEEEAVPQVTIPMEEVELEPEEILDFSELKPFVVYVSGSDSYDTEVLKSGRSDVNILAVINPLTKQILLINTPRDYYVETAAKSGEKDKLTHCGIYGIKCSMRTLSNLYGVDIEYFVRINFTGFKKLIDALGGVEVYSEYAFTAITRTEIQEGVNYLDGQQALDFARERYTLPGGDSARGKHQMEVITAVIEKATTGTTIINNYSDIVASVEGMFTMNVPAELISEMMKMQLSDMARWNVVSYSATGYGDMAECYSVPGMELAVMHPNMSSVRKANRLINMIFRGELLTEEVINSIT